MRPATRVLLLAVTLASPRAAAGQSIAFTSLGAAADTLVTDADAPQQWNTLGRTLYDAGRYREAIAAYERELQLRVAPSSDAALRIARAYLDIGNRKQAARWMSLSRDLRDGRVVLAASPRCSAPCLRDDRSRRPIS